MVWKTTQVINCFSTVTRAECGKTVHKFVRKKREIARRCFLPYKKQRLIKQKALSQHVKTYLSENKTYENSASWSKIGDANDNNSSHKYH